MSYYGNNNNNWNNRNANTEVMDISSGQYPQSADERFAGGPGSGSPAFGQQQPGQYPQQQQPGQIWRPGQYPQQQQPGQIWQPGQYPQQQPPNRAMNETNQYNDFLDRRGIPAITTEDMEILRECARESLYFRCLPLTTALCAGLLFAARTRPTYQPKWMHFMGATFLGYLGGKMSYRSTCESKLINSRSNSPFVNAIRKKRGLYVEEFAQDQSHSADLPAMESDWTTPKSYGIDEFEREDKEPAFSQSHGSYRRGPFGNRDDFADDGLQDGQPPLRSGSSYDELRLQNRSSFKA